jgi:hypothetical protein
MSIVPPYTTFISNEIRKAKKRGHSNMSLSLFPFCSVRKYTSVQQNNNLTAIKNPAKNEVDTSKSPALGGDRGISFYSLIGRRRHQYLFRGCGEGGR